MNTGNEKNAIWLRRENRFSKGMMMNSSHFENKLQEMIDRAAEIPSPQREKFFLLARRSRENNKALQEKINQLQQSLDYLRMGVKYLIFDLEATRRENVELRRKLNDARD